VVRIAPRYPDKLLGIIEALDDESLTLAEVARRVGAVAERAGIVRPSSVHVRALVGELRLQRQEDLDARRAALDEMTRRLPYTTGNAYEAAAAAERARRKARSRSRRRRR
jgi:hypothetical protein